VALAALRPPPAQLKAVCCARIAQAASGRPGVTLLAQFGKLTTLMRSCASRAAELDSRTRVAYAWGAGPKPRTLLAGRGIIRPRPVVVSLRAHACTFNYSLT
jgi:hypothetical protein